MDNLTVVERQGEAGEGTTIDFEEPFVLSLSCDDDGWILQVGPATSASHELNYRHGVQVNREQQYPHYFHVLHPSSVSSVQLVGDFSVSFLGIGGSGTWWHHLDIHRHLQP